jgi:hypothetical protein
MTAADSLHWVKQGTFGRSFLPRLMGYIRTSRQLPLLRQIDKE